MKIFILCLFFFLPGCQTAFSQDTIHWKKDFKLRWEDFKGIPDSSSEHKAMTMAEIWSTLTYTETFYEIKIHCVFHKNESWSVSTEQILLSHEQGHFDIAELFTRKMRMAFKEYIFNPKTINKDYSAIFSKITRERAKMDDLYDKETDYSLNSSIQQSWNKKILDEIKKLDAYDK